MRKLIGWGLLAVTTMAIIVFVSNNFSGSPNLSSDLIQNVSQTDRKLTIWWEQGFNFDEDEAIRQIVAEWEQKTGNQVELSFFPINSLVTKAERALEADKLPDILMTSRAERVLYPGFAWQGCLEDVTDILQPIEERYPPHILKGVTYYNAKSDRRSYYGVPIYQATMSIFYWQNLLNSVGLSAKDIPQDWQGFWQFWQQAHAKLNQSDRQIYGLGLSLSENENADDTHYLFEQILEAYNVALLDQQGNLDISDRDRQGIVDALTWYADIYHSGYIPPDAIEWSNTDNNLKLLNKVVLMTPNATLSIPASLKPDSELYHNQMAIAEFPLKPNGEPMKYPIFIRQAVIFKDSSRKSQAKDFLRYFIQPDITLQYLKATGSRNQPVQKSLWQDSYWWNSADPYRATTAKILTSESTVISHTAANPAYSQILRENIWGKALTQTIKNDLNPETAADLAIARIEEIFVRWEDISKTKN